MKDKLQLHFGFVAPAQQLLLLPSEDVAQFSSQEALYAEYLAKQCKLCVNPIVTYGEED